MSSKILVVIPAFNEERNIIKVINELREEFSCADLLVINDCSNDNTLQVLQELNVNHISLPFNLGYSGAVQTGLKYASEKNYDYVIQFDSDGQHIAKEAEKLFSTIQKSNVDIVIGSRFKEKSDYDHSFFRKIGTGIFQYIIKRFCKSEISDPTSGFQILNKKVIKLYAQMNSYPEYPDANLIIEMLFRGYKIKEIQVNMRERVFGESMHKGMLKPAIYMIKIFYAIIIIMLKQKNLAKEVLN